MTTTKYLTGTGVLAVAALMAAGAQAQDLKIGIMAVLSGPQAVLGGQLRDGFNLGVKHAGGKLGGLATSVTVQDDELKPDVAVGKAKQLIERDKVDFVVGPIFSNILMAIVKPITEANVFLISPNAGTSTLAGKGCSPYLLRDLLPERPAAGGARQVRAGQGLQTSVPAGAQLPGRQGHDRRLQEALQRRDRRRGLHAAGPARFLRRARQDRRRQARRLLRVHAGRHGRQPGQAVPPGGARFDPVPIGIHRRRVDAAGAAGRGGRLLLRHDLGAQHRHAREQEVRRRLREGVRLRARQLRHAGLRCRAADRQRGEGGGRQACRQGRAAGCPQEGRLQVACAGPSSSIPTASRCRTSTW